MSSCKGAYLIKAVDPTDRAPLWGLIGPTEDQYNTDLEAGYSRFYSEFLSSLDGRKALEALNNEVVGQPWRFHFYNARFIFRVVFHGYLKQYGTSEVLDRREKKIIDEFKKTKGEPQCGWEELRKQLRGDLENHEEQFTRFSRKFFMLDLYPENTARFPLKFEECQRHPSEDDE